MSLYIFCLRKGPSSMYATGGGWDHLKCVQLCTGRGCVTPHVYVRTYTISFHVSAVFLSYSVLFYFKKFNLTFIQKRCVRQKWLFCSKKINFCRHEISTFYLKLFLRTKFSQNAYKLNQIES